MISKLSLQPRMLCCPPAPEIVLFCTRGVLYIYSGEERFRFFDLGPDRISLAAERHQLPVVSLRRLLICRESGRTRRAIKPIKPIRCDAKRGLEFLQGRHWLLKLQQ